jgi:hypothetical protein
MVKKLLLLITIFLISSPVFAQNQPINSSNQILTRVDLVLGRLVENFDILVSDVRNIKESLNALKTDFIVMQTDYSTFKKNDWPVISNKVDTYVLKQSLLENDLTNIKAAYLPEIKTRVDSLEKNFNQKSNESEKTNTTLNIIVAILGALGTVALTFFLKSRSEKNNAV